MTDSTKCHLSGITEDAGLVGSGKVTKSPPMSGMSTDRASKQSSVMKADQIA